MLNKSLSWKNKRFKTKNSWEVQGMKHTQSHNQTLRWHEGHGINLHKEEPFHSLLVKSWIFTHNLRHSHIPFSVSPYLSHSSSTPHCVGWPGAYTNLLSQSAWRCWEERVKRKERKWGDEGRRRKTGTHTRQASAAPGERCTLRSRWAAERRRTKRRRTMRKK